MSELAADGVPVGVSLRVLKLSRQPYYRWRKQQVTPSELVEAYRANALFDAHRDDPEFAAMESFFALLQKNVLDRKRWRTRVELRIAIITWIERTYHRRRRQARLGRLTPIEYETIMNATVSLAA